MLCLTKFPLGIGIGLSFQGRTRIARPLVLQTCRSNSIDKGGNNKIEEAEAEAVEIRFKRGSRRRRKQEEDDGDGNKKAAAKDWESMSVSEKAIELYVGEKGLLFWLNKLAYASIFIIIGGWILFRFVGPALNLYHLDTPPLSPTAVFKD